MAESDFLSYSSIYDTFSKGPKSIYYGVGDEMLPGAILNVPQQDEDDEWGRTQRIADERAYDFIAKIYKTLFDPYNSIPEISLVPGEAGSEINVAKSMIKLVGRAGIDSGVFDLLNSKMTLCGIVIDGVNEVINIGDTDLSSQALIFNGVFSAEQYLGQTWGQVTYGNVFTKWFDDTSTPRFDISVDSKVFSFGIESGNPTFSIPTGGVLKVPGEIIVNTINPSATVAYNIGCSALKFNGVYASTGNFDIAYIGEIHVGYITNRETGLPIDIGSYILSDDINIRAKILNFYDNDLDVPFFKAYERLGWRVVDIGDPAGNHIINVLASYTNYQGTVCGGFNIFTPSETSKAVFGVSDFFVFHNKDILPGTHQEVNLGSSILSYNQIYTKETYTEGLYTTRTDQWYICGPFLNFKNSQTDEIVLTVGGPIRSIRAFGNILTTNVIPNDTDTYNVGSGGNRYNEVHTRFLYSQFGLSSNNEHGFVLSGLEGIQFSVDSSAKMAVCSGRIEVYQPMYVGSIYPNISGSNLGSAPNYGFDGLYLRDQVTDTVRRVYLSSGSLYVS